MPMCISAYTLLTYIMIGTFSHSLASDSSFHISLLPHPHALVPIARRHTDLTTRPVCLCHEAGCVYIVYSMFLEASPSWQITLSHIEWLRTIFSFYLIKLIVNASMIQLLLDPQHACNHSDSRAEAGMKELIVFRTDLMFVKFINIHDNTNTF